MRRSAARFLGLLLIAGSLASGLGCSGHRNQSQPLHSLNRSPDYSRVLAEAFSIIQPFEFLFVDIGVPATARCAATALHPNPKGQIMETGTSYLLLRDATVTEDTAVIVATYDVMPMLTRDPPRLELNCGMTYTIRLTRNELSGRWELPAGDGFTVLVC